jgi:hypothetical protein
MTTITKTAIRDFRERFDGGGGGESIGGGESVATIVLIIFFFIFFPVFIGSDLRLNLCKSEVARLSLP